MAYESVSKVLYLLAILGSIISAVIYAYWLLGTLIALDGIPLMTMATIVNWGWVLFGIGLIGIILDRKNYLLIIAVIAVIINSLGWLVGLMSDILLMAVVWLVAFVFMGLAAWQLRDKYTRIAVPTAIILVIWGCLRAAIDYMRVTYGGSIYMQSVFAGGFVAFLVIFIYLAMNFKSVGTS
jgi:hypothetical protein